MKTLADRLKEGMTIRGLRQADVVEKTGINKGALSSYLSGRYEPKQNNIFLLAQALNVNEAWLMGADVPMERAKTINFNETPTTCPFNSALKKLQNNNYDLTAEEQEALKQTLPEVSKRASKVFEKMYLQLSELHETGDSNMPEIGKRIRARREELGMTQEELAVKLGYKSKTTIAKIENGTNDIVQSKVFEFAHVLETTPAYLMGLTRFDESCSGKEASDEKVIKPAQNLLKFYGGAKKLMENYEQLSDLNKKKVIDYSNSLLAVQKMEEEQGYQYIQSPTSATIVEFHPKQESKIIALPYFRAGASAGTGIFILGNEAEDEIELPALPEYEAADFAIDVNGDSMEPDFFNEDIALVQRDAEMYVGDIGVFIVNGDAFIKELGEKELISKNKEYKNIPVRENDNVVCMGKVIGKVIY